jgi:hypothetical protein
MATKSCRPPSSPWPTCWPNAPPPPSAGCWISRSRRARPRPRCRPWTGTGGREAKMAGTPISVPAGATPPAVPSGSLTGPFPSRGKLPNRPAPAGPRAGQLVLLLPPARRHGADPPGVPGRPAPCRGRGHGPGPVHVPGGGPDLLSGRTAPAGACRPGGPGSPSSPRAGRRGRVTKSRAGANTSR